MTTELSQDGLSSRMPRGERRNVREWAEHILGREATTAEYSQTRFSLGGLFVRHIVVRDQDPNNRRGYLWWRP